ncbi:nucleotide exchange factor GrpE [Candidatus Halobonum tyrrellensis]|uniref:Protein GrpE n=1 Tax=Candidatus Halobonum tyrrellensis G22 TaxID=1324957 RepID=V4GUE0_9EURY|nr:nucleotide exchange factor GrpE [Candidatus Halobonum tyrrellensis]ESP88756.1 DnaJ/DnaK ATPase stimulator protein GrpE [Candidatus Halobonum tyrrellensis G22]
MSDEAGVDPDGAETESDAETEPARADDDREAESLAARVAEYDEELATAVAETVDRAEEAEARVDELEATLKRTKADFQNYKKRAKKRQEDREARATEDLVSRLTEVRDNLVRALDQEEGTDIRPGVESTLETFDRVFDEENVTPIEPEAGEAVDPQRHEVMMRVDSDRPEGTVVDVYKPGYEMADKVLEAAQVTVSDGSEE